MTGGVKLELEAATLDDAIVMATEKFRIIVGDPMAELPWSAHFEFYEVLAPGEGDVEDSLKSVCLVRIEFDRRDPHPGRAAV
jgi:hypothetical protein